MASSASCPGQIGRRVAQGSRGWLPTHPHTCLWLRPARLLCRQAWLFFTPRRRGREEAGGRMSCPQPPVHPLTRAVGQLARPHHPPSPAPRHSSCSLTFSFFLQAQNHFFSFILHFFFGRQNPKIPKYVIPFCVFIWILFQEESRISLIYSSPFLHLSGL